MILIYINITKHFTNVSDSRIPVLDMPNTGQDNKPVIGTGKRPRPEDGRLKPGDLVWGKVIKP